jgi:thermitase
MLKKLNWTMAALVTATLLAACNTTPPLEVVQPPERYKQTATLQINTDSDRAAIEAQYDGKVVVWQPEAGFAVIGLRQTGLQLQAATGTANMNAMRVPESVNGSGSSSWAGGSSSWAGGYSAWAGGSSSWAGGSSSWAGGNSVPAYTFSENVAGWQLIKLAEGQALTRNLGAGVKVAVIDTGIDLTHPAFNGRLAPSNEWKDFIDGDTTPQEVAGSNYGHGTSVAGIVLQVAPKATILPLRVLASNGQGDTDKVVQAINWALDRGAKVINLSLGGTSPDPSLENMVRFAASKGVFVITSSGNTGNEAVTVPATYANQSNNIFSVGSVGGSGAKSPFSTYGALELLAPGERIWGPAPNGQRSYWSGTSMATPVVSGVLALALAEPLRDANGLGNQLTNNAQQNETRNANNNTVYRDKLGMGYPDVYKFLEQTIAR